MKKLISFIFLCTLFLNGNSQSIHRQSFNDSWRFHLGSAAGAERNEFDDSAWRKLDLPHDWSIALPFDRNSPAGIGGGALNGGVGWYRKKFTIPARAKGKVIRVAFDGVYHNSEVWVNGHFAGKRPNGYVSFEYDISQWLIYGGENVIAVKADNSQQPNSRWYSGSGIYRNTWLTISDRLHILSNGTQVSSSINGNAAQVRVAIRFAGMSACGPSAMLYSRIVDNRGKVVAEDNRPMPSGQSDSTEFSFNMPALDNPKRWSVDSPHLYTFITTIRDGGTVDSYTIRFGIRTATFDIEKGFFLNDKALKIRGVCMHHDLGCLGTAVNRSAIRRQLQLLKEMGCNAIRTSHNIPAPELLDLCDEMGFLVMNEAYDMWAKSKNKYDYHLAWNDWSGKDLEDFIIRDRNHPSVVMWSLGNEIPEQWSEPTDSAGAVILRRLHNLTKALDPTRATMTANNEVGPWNKLLSSRIADVNGYNYNHSKWDSATIVWPGKPFIVTESVSALQTRGHYDFPADSIRIWPARWDLPVQNANADHTCSAFDNCRTPWGSSHETSLMELENNAHVSGMFVWTGFDYLGEPTPYGWPSRSSYFGIIDLAGFPKDVYYLYQSVWTSKDVLHIFPHWNWKPGQMIDIWAYYNNADEVELYLNGRSVGKRTKTDTSMHVAWKIPFETGALKAISRKNGKMVLEKEIRTAGIANKLTATSFDNKIDPPHGDLSFITVAVQDKDGIEVPDAVNLIRFEVSGGSIAGVDNGYQASLESFQAPYRKAYNGKCLVVLRPAAGAKEVVLTATSAGLKPVTLRIKVK